MNKKLPIILTLFICMFFSIIIITSEEAQAGSYNGQDLAYALLANQSTYVSSSYWDRDREGCRQATVLSSLGTMSPTNGSSFALLSTGIAGANPVTTYTENPGNERGTWFKHRYGKPRDHAELTMTLQVPPYMHYLYYDFQFFSTEVPEYIGSKYNDEFEVIVYSPSQGTSTYVCDVNSGNFVLDSNYISGTGFDIFAQSGIPDDVDIVDTTPRTPGADAGATAVITRGGEAHPVSPNEEITVTFIIKDDGDNQFDSAVFIDNLVFLGYAKTDILARKNVEDLNGGLYENEDIIEYTITISNAGDADQNNNPENEFEDTIDQNLSYVPGSVTATSGTVEYDSDNHKIIWNGEILQESSVVIRYQTVINSSVLDGTIIPNQGIVYWDSNEDGTNNAIEYTDDSSVDDGIDLDGDGETDDDDSTDISVYGFQPPSEVIEGFSDDTAGESASETYCARTWFETSSKQIESNFEVAGTYYYSTSKSFKTKMRNTSGNMFWNYNLDTLESDITWWEVWFTCGNATENSDLYLVFKNTNDQDIAKIKFEYDQLGSDHLTEWIVKMYYYSPDHGWLRINTRYLGGFLYNDWYKLRIEKHGTSYINYSLYNSNGELIEVKQARNLGTSFSNLEQIIWSSTKDPVVCPVFFWDENKIGLTN